MASDTTEKQTSALEVEAQPSSPRDGPVYDDVAEKVDYDRAGAINAEAVEHRMTVVEAVKAYPAASWWAFVMSCTIVSSCLAHDRLIILITLRTGDRSWSHTVYS